MQKIAQELNLSETVFLLPATSPGCAAQARIFTPTVEMRFAGHPTLGASFVLVDEGAVPPGATGFCLEEKIGRVPIRVERGERDLFWLTTPPIHFGSTVDPAVCAQVLGVAATDLLDLAPQVVTAGNPCLFIAVKDKAAVDRSFVDMGGYRRLPVCEEGPLCVFVFAPTPSGAYSRMFAPEHGVVEDPATGSATGPLAAFMMKHRLIPLSAGTRMVSEQGTKMGRKSLLHVLVRGEGGGNGIEVGGHVTALVEAKMTLPTASRGPRSSTA